METFAIIGAVYIIGLLAIIVIIGTNLKICKPDEVLIFSGRQRQLPDGTIVGYRVIQGGRGFRIPLLERVDRLSLNVIPLNLEIKNGYTKDGSSLTVYATAAVKVGSEESVLANAIERFLSKSPQEIGAVAREVLEGNLRNTLAAWPPDAVSNDRVKFIYDVMVTAAADLRRLGLHLDALAIQRVEGR